MDKNFLMLNFCTEYSSKGNTNKEMKKNYCFGTIFGSENNGIIQTNIYTIKLYKIGDFLNKEKNNNACLTDEAGIRKHLKIAQSIFKFKCQLKDEGMYFTLVLTLQGDLIYHKYLLSWVRYLYEYPFNVFLAEAHKLKKLPEFRFESIINLFNLVGATSGINDHGIAIHAIGATDDFKKLMTTKEIKDKLKTLCGGHTRVNSIFPVINDEDGLDILGENNLELHSLDYWESEDKYNERVVRYKDNYKILTNYKKNNK